jgi:hypothetical protein
VFARSASSGIVATAVLAAAAGILLAALAALIPARMQSRLTVSTLLAEE